MCVPATVCRGGSSWTELHTCNKNMALRYTTERLETVSDHDNWDVKVVPLLTQIFELMDENQDGSVDEVEGALVRSALFVFDCWLAYCLGSLRWR